MRIESKTLKAIRSDVCNAMLVWLSLGAITILSVATVFRPRFLPNEVLIGASVLVSCVSVIAALRHRMPLVVRGGSIIALAFIAGMGKLLIYAAPHGFLDFALAVIISAALFGERAGIATAGAAVLAMVTGCFAFMSGYLPAPPPPPEPLAGTTWVIGTLMLTVTTFGPLIVIARLAQHVELERLRAQEASDAKSNFLAMMSHELRTPLNAIIGFSEALTLDYAGPPGSLRYREYAEDIHGSARHLLSIVDDLLNIAWLEVRQLIAATEPLDVAEELARAMTTLEGQAAKAGLDLRLDVADATPRGQADPKLFQQIMINLRCPTRPSSRRPAAA